MSDNPGKETINPGEVRKSRLILITTIIGVIVAGVGVLLAGAYFYWSQVRPSRAIKKCTAEVRLSPHNIGKFSQEEYDNCLRRMGIGP